MNNRAIALVLALLTVLFVVLNFTVEDAGTIFLIFAVAAGFGAGYLQAVTTLLQRVRAAHPTAGVFEAADFQWWWRSPRSTDALPQLFWFDDSGLPEAAVIATDWGSTNTVA